ncbi:hypothetical protein VE00_07381 [Pseudogymnoascus sp. WSF 3629]|nr:hypothetical protein VE00_07381 [Pseudogymnoascus sp. WSF 3629]
MPPTNKFLMARALLILIPAHVDPEAEAKTLAEYNSLSGSIKSKLLALLAYSRGRIILDSTCPRYTSSQQVPHFVNVVICPKLFPARYCVSCA